MLLASEKGDGGTIITGDREEQDTLVLSKVSDVPVESVEWWEE